MALSPLSLRAAGLSLLLATAALSSLHAQETTETLAPARLADVDPYIGVDWAGEVFPGALVPFGMVKLGPDMISFAGKPGKSGYLSAGLIEGFSHLHLSGAAGKYGNILVMPVSGPVHWGQLATPRDRESAQPGLFETHLPQGDIDVALTATRRVGMHRYRFARGGDTHITLDLDHLLTKSTKAEGQRFLGGTLTAISDHEITGVGHYTGGWNEGGPYTVYFDAVIDQHGHTSLIAGNRQAQSGSLSVDGDAPLAASFDLSLPGGTTVLMKVGVSFISVVQARHTITQEAPGWNFDAIVSQARQKWRSALSAIDLPMAPSTRRHQFYTALYHTMIMPSDLTEENAKWMPRGRFFGDFYTLWDLFRTSFPLYGLITPSVETAMIASLIEDYQHDGYLPDGRSGQSIGRTQGGSNADVVIADAWLQHLPGLDFKTAYDAVLKDAEIEPPTPRQEGRGGLTLYKRLGYVPSSVERAGSRTVEYSYDDFAAAELACGLHHPAVANRLARRADNWTHLWDNSLTVHGITGFIRPKKANGAWAAADMTKRGTWPDFFYEGDLWTYSLYAPQDVARLIDLSGGRDAFVKRLDFLFDHYLFDMTNEPGFLIPMLYHWAGRPDKTADRVHEYLEKWFEDTRGGLPANDDSGAMSSWYVFETLGLYPVAGQDLFLISTPTFPLAVIHLGSGHNLRLKTEGWDAGGINRYIQKATWNGHPLAQSWLRGDQLRQGGTLTLTLGATPGAWGQHTPPPSLSDHGGVFCR